MLLSTIHTRPHKLHPLNPLCLIASLIPYLHCTHEAMARDALGCTADLARHITEQANGMQPQHLTCRPCSCCCTRACSAAWPRTSAAGCRCAVPLSIHMIKPLLPATMGKFHRFTGCGPSVHAHRWPGTCIPLVPGNQPLSQQRQHCTAPPRLSLLLKALHPNHSLGDLVLRQEG